MKVEEPDDNDGGGVGGGGGGGGGERKLLWEMLRAFGDEDLAEDKEPKEEDLL